MLSLSWAGLCRCPALAPPPAHPPPTCRPLSSPLAQQQEWQALLKKLPAYANALLEALERGEQQQHAAPGSGEKRRAPVAGAGAGAGGSKMDRMGSGRGSSADLLKAEKEKAAGKGKESKAAGKKPAAAAGGADTTPPSAGKGQGEAAATTFTNPLTGGGGAGGSRKPSLPLSKTGESLGGWLLEGSVQGVRRAWLGLAARGYRRALPAHSLRLQARASSRRARARSWASASS